MMHTHNHPSLNKAFVLIFPHFEPLLTNNDVATIELAVINIVENTDKCCYICDYVLDNLFKFALIK